jgi:hypothetical protein
MNLIDSYRKFVGKDSDKTSAKENLWHQKLKHKKTTVWQWVLKINRPMEAV